jgi:spermidine synthase
MKPWDVIGRQTMPDGTELTLVRHPSEFAILAGGESLMTSRAHHSEDVLGTVGCQRARTRPDPAVLVSGLGMGFTLRAALDALPPSARVVVAELAPVVVAWNRGPLGHLAGHPLDDPRVRVEVADVAEVLRANAGGFDAVILDVDNGPFALAADLNERLYDRGGVAAARAALRTGGVLAVWSAAEDRPYERRLRAGGFRVRTEQVPSHTTRTGRGRRHTILIAERTVG